MRGEYLNPRMFYADGTEETVKEEKVMNPVLIVLLFIAAFLLWASVAYAFPLIGRIISKYMKDIEKISEEFDKEDDLK